MEPSNLILFDQIYFRSIMIHSDQHLKRMITGTKEWQKIVSPTTLIDGLHSNQLSGILLMNSTGALDLTHSLRYSGKSEAMVGIQGNKLSARAVSMPVTAQFTAPLKVTTTLSTLLIEKHNSWSTIGIRIRRNGTRTTSRTRNRLRPSTPKYPTRRTAWSRPSPLARTPV